MAISEAQLAANRRNALKSTGPRTPEGKRISRANAIKHGLCANIVQPEDAEFLQERTVAVYEALRPQDSFQSWLVDRIALYTIRIERCERMERRSREKISMYAELSWDDDRRLEAEILGSALTERPSETVEGLRRSPQGCDWLLRRWKLLEVAAANESGWDQSQTTLAHDLLGMPAQFRAQGWPEPAILAREQIDDLEARRKVVADLDEAEQALVCADLNHDSEPELRRIRRYESALHGKLRWSMEHVRRAPPFRVLVPEFAPKMHETPPTELKPEPKSLDEKLIAAHPPNSWHPPFDLDPDEFPKPGQRQDLPALLRSRKEKQRKKEERRREKRRRKLDRLRA